MTPVAPLLTAALLCLFGVVLWTSTDRVGRVARRPTQRDPRLLATVAVLFGLTLVVGWLVFS